ncbi:MAG: MBL fold metallo-hydrolase [bacterium]
MRVVFWGVRGSVPCCDRNIVGYGGNTACVEIRTRNNDLIILDMGTGVRALGLHLMQEREIDVSTLEQTVDFTVAGTMQLLSDQKSTALRALEGSQPFKGTASILLSHNHVDHINGLPFFIPAYIPEFEFNVYSLLKADHRLRDVLEGQQGGTYFPVAFTQMAAKMHLHEIAEDTFALDDTVVKSRYLNHPQGCLGYRITSGEMTVAYCTDNEHAEGRLDANVLELADGADVFIYDCQYTPDEYGSKKNWGHSTWEEGAKLAREAGAKKLVMFHHDPQHDDNFIRRMEEEARGRFPNLLAAYEGLVITDYPCEPTVIETDDEESLKTVPPPAFATSDSALEINCGGSLLALRSPEYLSEMENAGSGNIREIVFRTDDVKRAGGKSLSALADAIKLTSDMKIPARISGASRHLIEKLTMTRFHLVAKIDGYS